MRRHPNVEAEVSEELSAAVSGQTPAGKMSALLDEC